ncbi:MAG TPA: type II toxin-antitoxin system VapC family toxin [Baekduia sp.]|jgi:PIN domain nuclease of toxin-antitoxin system|nr:type II toxin-antitoxin system VapC family toxin [Baekduia sp.]
MRLLPDSHALIWWLDDAPQLSTRAGELMSDDDNPLLFSAAALWEIRIKMALGKLRTIDKHGVLEEDDITLLPITHAHAAAAAALPLHHRDPFDRMLIAQAQIEDAVLLTADPAMAAYDVRTVW